MLNYKNKIIKIWYTAKLHNYWTIIVQSQASIFVWVGL